MSADNGFWLIGNLTRDCQLKYLPSGTPVADFSIAHNRRYKDSNGNQAEETSFFDCTVFGKLGESLAQYLTKGKFVAIGGAMKQDRWEKDGQTHSRVKLIVDGIRLLPSGSREGQEGGYQRDNSGSNAGPSGSSAAPSGQRPGPDGGSSAQRPSYPKAQPAAAPGDDFQDDIPF